MRCFFMSDLHLERQEFPWDLPHGDVLVIAGDLCEARCLDPGRSDRYHSDQRSRVLRLMDKALDRFRHVLVIAGNHEHYGLMFEETTGLMRQHLAGITVLDDDTVEISGIRFFGATLWTDFDGNSQDAMNRVRKRMGEFFFVRTAADGDATRPPKFQPEHALAAFERSWTSLTRSLEDAAGKPTVVISHHAPSHQGLGGPSFTTSSDRHDRALDCAYASDLDRRISALAGVPVWIHGHTHVRRAYRIADTRVLANCRGFDSGTTGGRPFTPASHFEI